MGSSLYQLFGQLPPPPTGEQLGGLQDQQQKMQDQMQPPTSAWTPPTFDQPSFAGGPGEAEQTVKIQIEAPDMQPAPPTQPPAQGAPQQPYPTPPPPPTGGPNNPWQNAPPGAVAPATPPTAPGAWTPGGPPSAGVGNAPNVGPAPTQPKPPGWDQWTPQEKASYGGQDMFADPSQADYQSVQQYSDAAYDQAMKRLNPQMEAQNKRMQQDLINKGIDPNSAQGQKMMDDLSRQQADQMNSATFGAMQFGQGIQNQMAQQEQAKSNLAGNMQQALWQNQLGASGQGLQNRLGTMQNDLGWGNLQSGHALGRAGLQSQHALGAAGLQNQFNLGMRGQDLQARGQDIQFGLGKSGQDLQRYGMDQGHQLGMGNLDLGRQQQGFNEMMGLDASQFRNWQANQNQQNWQDQMLMGMLTGNQGFAPGQISGGGQFTNTEQGWGSGFGSMMGGMFSDRRLKRNINKVGEINGVNMYSYNYAWDDVERIGPMAQEVPWAAFPHESGFLMVDPRRVL